jgi:hypothetical protein
VRRHIAAGRGKARGSVEAVARAPCIESARCPANGAQRIYLGTGALVAAVTLLCQRGAKASVNVHSIYGASSTQAVRPIFERARGGSRDWRSLQSRSALHRAHSLRRSVRANKAKAFPLAPEDAMVDTAPKGATPQREGGRARDSVPECARSVKRSHQVERTHQSGSIITRTPSRAQHLPSRNRCGAMLTATESARKGHEASPRAPPRKGGVPLVYQRHAICPCTSHWQGRLHRDPQG